MGPSTAHPTGHSFRQRESRRRAPALDAPALAYVQAIASAVPAETLEPIEGTTPEAALLSHIAACRSAVADALYQSSRDYQVLCDLVHESLPACEEAIDGAAPPSRRQRALCRARQARRGLRAGRGASIAGESR